MSCHLTQLLYYTFSFTVGVAVFAGLAVMILLIPVNGVLANMTKKLQIKQMKNKDRRVKMMNEILSGIKVVYTGLVVLSILSFSLRFMTDHSTPRPKRLTLFDYYFI